MAIKRARSDAQPSHPNKRRRLSNGRKYTTVSSETMSSQDSATLSSSPDKAQTDSPGTTDPTSQETMYPDSANPFSSPDNAQVDGQSTSDSTTTVTDGQSPYTAKFFRDMAHTIAKLFPFEAFAKEHHCNFSEVSQAISAVVVAPLADPEFSWHEDDSITIPEYAKSMIDNWDEYYRHKLEASSVQPRKARATEKTTRMASPKSKTSSEDESTVSASGHPEIVSPVSEPIVSAPAVPTPAVSATCRVNMSSQDIRVHVFKDDFGNYVPVPHEDEITIPRLEHIYKRQSHRLLG